jgi:uncharacterized protein YndB with AHSA1/START domain
MQTEKGSFSCEKLGDLDVRFTKKVKAPRSLVWRAHTEPSLLAQWWGPEGFTHVNEGFEMKVGGVWKYMMTGPDGTRYPNLIKFTELVEPSLMAMDHGTYDAVHFKVRTEFSEADGWTTITSVMSFPKKETRDATVKFAEPGHQSTMGRLEGLLAVMEGGAAPFVISRVFNAPRSLLYDLYSKPEHQKPLLGPAGSDKTVSNMDFRVGGTHHYAMEAGDGGQWWGLQRYLEIVPGEKIVYIQSFSDKDRGITAHPMAPTWPKETLTTISLADEPGGKCRVMVSWTPHNSDAAGLATFDGARGGMQGGFGAQFAKMDEYLAKIQG